MHIYTLHIVIANCESSVSESMDDNGQIDVESQDFMTDLDELPEQDTDCNDHDDHDSST